MLLEGRHRRKTQFTVVYEIEGHTWKVERVYSIDQRISKRLVHQLRSLASSIQRNHKRFTRTNRSEVNFLGEDSRYAMCLFHKIGIAGSSDYFRMTFFAPPLRGLIVVNLRFDLFRMGAGISPRVHEVFGAQRWICSEQSLLRSALTTSLFEEPDGNARANNARFASADAWYGVYAGERIAQILDHPFQNLRLFSGRQFVPKLFKGAQGRDT